MRLRVKLGMFSPTLAPRRSPAQVGTPNNPTLAYGEEVIYPAFSIPQPGFLTEEHAAWWRSVVPPYEPRRFWLREGRALYPAQHGQVLVMRNVSFKNVPATDSWAAGACMSQSTSHRGMPALPAGAAPEIAQRAVLVNTPDSAFFQHFLDRCGEKGTLAACPCRNFPSPGHACNTDAASVPFPSFPFWAELPS